MRCKKLTVFTDVKKWHLWIVKQMNLILEHCSGKTAQARYCPAECSSIPLSPESKQQYSEGLKKNKLLHGIGGVEEASD